MSDREETTDLCVVSNPSHAADKYEIVHETIAYVQKGLNRLSYNFDELGQQPSVFMPEIIGVFVPEEVGARVAKATDEYYFERQYTYIDPLYIPELGNEFESNSATLSSDNLKYVYVYLFIYFRSHMV